MQQCPAKVEQRPFLSDAHNDEQLIRHLNNDFKN